MTDHNPADEIRAQAQHISDLLNYVAGDLLKRNAPLDEGHVFVRAGNAHTALMDLAHRLDREASARAERAPISGSVAASCEDDAPGDDIRPDRMNPFVDRDVHETLQNVIEGIRLVQHSLFRTDRNEAREVRFSAEQWHGLHRHCETLVKALQHEAVYLADSLGERHKLRPGVANPKAQGRGQEALS